MNSGEYTERRSVEVYILPSPCMAFSQSLSVNSFRWRIRGEGTGNASHFRMDHVTRNALAARKNEAKGLGKYISSAAHRT